MFNSIGSIDNPSHKSDKFRNMLNSPVKVPKTKRSTQYVQNNSAR